jgi:superfamily I DNA/RNA helicase
MDIKPEGSIKDETIEEDKYATAKRKRQEGTDAVILSPSNKKIVVAGPGTGKTHLFKNILEGKKNPITLTFVNSLVEDLSLDLCGLSEVKTLHGFARGILKTAARRPIKVFPKLSEVIKQDARVLLNQEIDFDHVFHNRDDANPHIPFYRKRKNYYGYYGYSDIVFAAVRYLEENGDKIPIFGQVVVDEFQDFNKLEVSLIDLLAKKSPILLAGDDDQALYESLKSASSEHIRQRYDGRTSGYAAFTLPYCSRCTRVIVDAFNDIVMGATRDGYLATRVSKPFLYFDDEEKDRESEANPLLICSRLYAKQIPWFIEKHVREIAKEVRAKFTVLIICPTKTQCRFISAALNDKGFQRVGFVERREAEEPVLLDGLKLLLEDEKCNLGWRIVAKNLLNAGDFEDLLKKTDKDDASGLWGLIETGRRREVSGMLKILRAVRDARETNGAALAELLPKLGIEAYAMAKHRLREDIRSGTRPASNPGISKTPITVTTIQSAKGLDADYVFIAHFDDRYFIKDTGKTNISDQDICNFLVALTRARKRVFLISSDPAKMPVLLKWISEKRIGNTKAMDKPAP